MTEKAVLPIGRVHHKIESINGCDLHPVINFSSHAGEADEEGS
jgi:hypothetical protein